MQTPEEVAAEKAKNDALAAEAAAKVKAEQEQAAAEKIRLEAEAKVAEEKRAEEIKTAATTLAESLVKESLSKQAHERDVERATWKLKAAQEFGAGDEGKLKEAVELANRGLSAFDKDGSALKTLTAQGLDTHPDVLRVFVELGKAVANDSFKMPSYQPSLPPKPKTLTERLGGG